MRQEAFAQESEERTEVESANDVEFVLGEIGDARGRIGRHLRRVEVRIAYLTFGFLMHVGIELLMEVGPYLYVTCSMYSCVLGPPLCRRLLRRTDPIGP